MSIEKLKQEIISELEVIFGSGFSVEVTNTNSVPHSSDAAITFPNLQSKSQRCKIIETCVLYIDIRRSTELNLKHKSNTVAKLYSAFVRTMTYCAAYNNGHVRGIIGDRIMVIFNPATAFNDAMETAVAMNSAAQHLLNKYFKANEIKCGIGIDYGRMMVTKTGIRRHGVERSNYQSLVWLGRPANVASKLTDAANKSHSYERQVVRQAKQNPLAGFLGINNGEWVWDEVEMQDFLENLENDYSQGTNTRFRHKNPFIQAFYLTTDYYNKSTPPILMTNPVYDGYKRHNPNAASIKNNWFKKQRVSVVGYTGEIYGGDVIKVHFQK